MGGHLVVLAASGSKCLVCGEAGSDDDLKNKVCYSEQAEPVSATANEIEGHYRDYLKLSSDRRAANISPQRLNSQAVRSAATLCLITECSAHR